MVLRIGMWKVGLVLMVVAANAGTAAGEERHIWVPPTHQSDTGLGTSVGKQTWPVTATGAVRFAVAVPADIERLTTAKLVLIPGHPGGAANLRLGACRTEDGQFVGGCPTVTIPFTGVTEQILEIDVTIELKPHISKPGRGYVAVTVATSPTGATDHWLGLRLSYEAATNAATLGSNVFSGTQIAPAFAGDGTALTGVAKLGANTFSGTQTAPAFVGNGQWLTGLPKLSGTDANGSPLQNLWSTANVWAGGGNDFRSPTFSEVPIDFLNCRAGVTGTPGPCQNSSRITLSLNGAPLLSGPRGYGTCGWRQTFPFDYTCSIDHSNDTFLGFDAGRMNPTTPLDGSANTGVGFRTLQNIQGARNSALGMKALYGTTTGADNTAVGQSALIGNTSGSRNVALGSAAGSVNTTGSNNIYLGANVVGVPGESNTIYLGKAGVQTRTVVAGIYNVTPADPSWKTVVIDATGQLGTINFGAALNLDSLQKTVGDQQRRIDALEQQVEMLLQALTGRSGRDRP